MLTRAHQRVAFGEESVGIVARDEKVESPTRKLLLADQAHAQDHRLCFGVQRSVSIRRDPRRNSPAVGLVASRHQAMDLSRAIDILQQWFGQGDLHRRVQQLLPVATDSLPEHRDRWELGILVALACPGRDVYDEAGGRGRGELSTDLHAGPIDHRGQRLRLCQIEYTHESIARQPQHAISRSLSFQRRNVRRTRRKYTIESQRNLDGLASLILNGNLRHSQCPCPADPVPVAWRIVTRRHPRALAKYDIARAGRVDDDRQPPIFERSLASHRRLCLPGIQITHIDRTHRGGSGRQESGVSPVGGVIEDTISGIRYVQSKLLRPVNVTRIFRGASPCRTIPLSYCR